MSQVIVQIYKLSLRIKTRVVKVKHDLLHIVLEVNQSNALW